MLGEILEHENLHRRVEELRDERDLYRALLHMQAEELRRVAGDADTVTARLRGLLQQPARTPQLFRAKVNALGNELATIAGSATGARLPSVARRAGTLQENLETIAGQSTLSGDDLLPVIASIEELLKQLAVAYHYVTDERRLSPEMPESVAAGDSGETAAGADAAVMGAGGTDAASAPAARGAAPASAATPGGATPLAARMAVALHRLAEQLSKEHHRDVHLITLGLEAVPADWDTAIFDMLSQLVRNAIEHGIEPSDVRRRCGKSPYGTLLIEFRPRPDGGFELKFQDDGAGVDTEAVRDSAIIVHAIDAASTENAPHKRLASLILLPGVTTAREPEGRGQGLKIVRDQAKRLGGHIKVASKRGQFLRFSIDFDAKEA